jgi:hypothetical protein
VRVQWATASGPIMDGRHAQELHPAPVSGPVSRRTTGHAYAGEPESQRPIRPRGRPDGNATRIPRETNVELAEKIHPRCIFVAEGAIDHVHTISRPKSPTHQVPGNPNEGSDRACRSRPVSDGGQAYASHDTTARPEGAPRPAADSARAVGKSVHRSARQTGRRSRPIDQQRSAYES